MISYYKVLGVSEKADAKELKAAFRKLQMQVHPDRTGGDDTLAQLVNEAYETLKDEDKRAAYDLTLKDMPSDRINPIDPYKAAREFVERTKRRINDTLDEAERFAKHRVETGETYDVADAFDLSWTKIRQHYEDMYEQNRNMHSGLKKVFGVAAGFWALYADPAAHGVLANIAAAASIGAGTALFTHYARHLVAFPVTAFEVAGNVLAKGLVAQFNSKKTGYEQKTKVGHATRMVRYATVVGAFYGIWQEGRDLGRDVIVKGLLLQESRPTHSLIWRAGEGTVRVGTQVVTGLLPK